MGKFSRKVKYMSLYPLTVDKPYDADAELYPFNAMLDPLLLLLLLLVRSLHDFSNRINTCSTLIANNNLKENKTRQNYDDGSRGWGILHGRTYVRASIQSKRSLRSPLSRPTIQKSPYAPFAINNSSNSIPNLTFPSLPLNLPNPYRLPMRPSASSLS